MPTALIIGASRGLGRALAQEHLKRGWTVIATVRDVAALADLAIAHGAALGVETLDSIDWAGVDALQGRLAGTGLDLLFVNAGISGPVTAPIGEVEPDAFTQLMLVNALAPLRIIDRFAELLAPDATAAVMTSGLGSIANNNGGWEAYRMSKAALNMGFVSLAQRRRIARQTWLTVAPGWVRTDMGGPSATLSIDQSITAIADLLERRHGSGTIAYVNYDGRELPW
ncbi:MAG: SDR family NAD(P)-dependent oxidoreductase [Sphingomonas bacterium]